MESRIVDSHLFVMFFFMLDFMVEIFLVLKGEQSVLNDCLSTI